MSEEEKDKNPLVVAEELRKSLMTTSVEENREQVLEATKQMFIAHRMETSSLQEKVRATALLKLLEKVDNDDKISTQQLLRIVDALNQGGEKDLSSVTGGGKGGIVINNTSQTANISNPMEPSPDNINSEGNQIQNIGFLTEALSSVQRALQDPEAFEAAKRIIDVTPEDPKDE